MFLSIANLINLIIDNWEISLTVIAVFASLCLGVFKGAKHGIRAIILVLVVEILIFGGIALYKYINQDLLGLIKFAIAWLPTIIFLLIVVLSTLTGMRRGLRKSLILLLHSLIIAGICLGLFFFCITSPVIDKLLLDLINTFMGADGLQSSLGVSADCETLREVLVEYFNGLVVDLDDFGILLQANSAYVITLINMAYRIVFAIAFFIVYELLLFIMYIIYLIFYPERRYKRKRNIRFANNRADSSYKKRPVGGGCVGAARGLVSGIISISFIGSVFFIAAGGIGASKLPEDFSFGEDYEEYVSIYRSIEDYGEQGIFKVLNAIRDPEDTPYYLFAADIVFSGGLNDELHGVNGDIKFRQELAAYTGFAKDTLALLLKYDSEGEIAAILSGQSSTDDAMDKILNVCLKPDFRVEFDNLIENFDTQTYVINFALSLADAVIDNVDDMSFMQSVSADNKELLKVLFKHKYNCSVIPDDNDEDPPHLTINHLFTKKDAQIVLDIVLSFVAEEIDTDNPATIARVLLPYIEDLSIFSTERSSEMDPVLGRLYCYLENKYLTEEGERGISYAEVKKESVQWTKEIRALIGVSDGIFTMYDNVQGSDNILNAVSQYFDEDSADYAENVKNFEELTAVISDSKLIGKVLNSSKISNLLYEQLQGINENVYFPEKITYENTYDGEGNLISHGEAYQLLRGLRLLADKDNKELVDKLVNSSEDNSFEDLIKKLSQTLTTPDPNAPENSLTSYLTESVLLRSTLSAVICDSAGDMLVVPNLSFEKVDGNRVLINKKELKQIFEALPEVVDLILPLASEEINAEHINNILVDKTFNSLLDNGNKIVEATIAKALLNVLEENDMVVIPQRLVNDESWEEWITIDGASGEVRKFVNTINTLELKVDDMMNGELNSTEIFDTLKTLEREEIEKLLESGIFHYTASNMMTDNKFKFDFDIIVPSTSYIIDAYRDRVIRSDELANVFVELKDFGLTTGMNNDDIVRTLVEKKEVVERSNIISASVVNFIITHQDIRDALNVPSSYLTAGSLSNLEKYDANNIWHAELPKMIDAIDEIFGISGMAESEEFEFNSDTISEKTNGLLKSLNNPSSVNSSLTRLELCSESAIIRNNITVELDKSLSDAVDEKVRNSAKQDGYYTKEELIALSETATMFDIEVLNIDNSNLANSVKGQILTINEVRDDGRTALEVMYPSKIVRYFITREIDKALNGEDDTDESVIDVSVRDSFKTSGDVKVYTQKEISALVDALNALDIADLDGVSSDSFTSLSKYKNNIDTICNSSIVTGIITKQIDSSLGEDLIERAVQNQIKGDSLAYSKEAISSLVDALDVLGLDDFNEFDTVEINDIKDDNTLNVVYRSDIFVGVMTKKVKDACVENENLYYHNLANRLDLPVLKQKEIKALLDLLGNTDIDDFDVNSVSLSDVRNQLWNEDIHEGRLPNKDSSPDSYLISYNLTKSLIKNDTLYVSSEIYVNDFITVDEQLRFISALEILQSDGTLDDLQIDEHMKVPDASTRATILESEIMRATFSNHVFTKNNNISFLQSDVDMSVRITADGNNAELPVVNSAQLEALFDVIDCVGSDTGELIIPSINSENIKTFDEEEINCLYEFDATRYTMSKLLIQLSDNPDCEVFNFYQFSINYIGTVEKKSLTNEAILKLDDIKSILAQL